MAIRAMLMQIFVLGPLTSIKTCLSDQLRGVRVVLPRLPLVHIERVNFKVTHSAKGGKEP